MIGDLTYMLCNFIIIIIIIIIVHMEHEMFLVYKFDVMYQCYVMFYVYVSEMPLFLYSKEFLYFQHLPK